MLKSITISIPIRDGTTQAIQAIQVTEHFAVHPSIDVIVMRNVDDKPWTITHIPSLCSVIYSDNQANAEQCARALEALDVDWDIPCPVDGHRDVKAAIIGACRCLAKAGIAWNTWC